MCRRRCRHPRQVHTTIAASLAIVIVGDVVALQLGGPLLALKLWLRLRDLAALSVLLVMMMGHRFVHSRLLIHRNNMLDEGGSIRGGSGGLIS